jgi:hypothetical protein
MTKTFVIQVEYPDCDFVSSEEIMEVTQECIENHLERYFGANIMDGDYDRIKVKEVTDFVSLVAKMRKAQKRQEYTDSTLDREAMYECLKLTKQRESEVDEYLKKMEV